MSSPKEITNHNSSDEIICLSPSVNWTPIGSNIIPIPYQVSETLDSSSNLAKTVKAKRDKVFHANSIADNCTGDEDGSKGGVISGTVNGENKAITFENSIRIEGNPTTYDGCLYKMNSGNTIGQMKCQEFSKKFSTASEDMPVKIFPESAEKDSELQIIFSALPVVAVVWGARIGWVAIRALVRVRRAMRRCPTGPYWMMRRLCGPMGFGQAHHVVSDFAYRLGGRRGPRIPGTPSLNDGIAVCLRGNAATPGTPHNRAQNIVDRGITNAGALTGGVAPASAVLAAGLASIPTMPFSAACKAAIAAAVTAQVNTMPMLKPLRATKSTPTPMAAQILRRGTM